MRELCKDFESAPESKPVWCAHLYAASGGPQVARLKAIFDKIFKGAAAHDPRALSDITSRLTK
jgi:hypothetical protein